MIKELEKSCLGEDVDLKISSRQSSVRILSMREEVTLRNGQYECQTVLVIVAHTWTSSGWVVGNGTPDGCS